MKKNRDFSWFKSILDLLQKVTKKINKIVIEKYVYSIDSETRMYQ